MNSLIRPHDVLRRLPSAHTAVREPSRDSRAAWLSHFLFTKLRYYFLDEHPLGLSRAMQEQQNGEGAPRAWGQVPGSAAHLQPSTTSAGGRRGNTWGARACGWEGSVILSLDGGRKPGPPRSGVYCVQMALARRTAGSQGPHSHPSRAGVVRPLYTKGKEEVPAQGPEDGAPAQAGRREHAQSLLPEQSANV